MENGTRREAEQKNFKLDFGSERSCKWVRYVRCMSMIEIWSVEIGIEMRDDGVDFLDTSLNQLMLSRCPNQQLPTTT